MYEQKLNRIKQYSRKQVNLIAQEEIKGKRSHIAQRKRSLLNGLAVVEQCEQGISIVPHLVWFCIQACAALVLGALLNAASFDAAAKDEQHGIWFMIAFLTVFVCVKAITLTHDLVTILRFKA